jgi:alpha-tubulin suppressor-like RCC1 family protein
MKLLLGSFLLALLLWPLTSPAAIVVWGGVYAYETNPPAIEGRIDSIAAGGTFGMALKRDGTFAIWGDPCNTRLPSDVQTNDTPVVQVAGGPSTSALLFADGLVRSWGDTESRYSISPGSGVTAVACGRSFILALKSDGTVFALGEDVAGGTLVPPDLARVTAIAANGFCMALKTDRTVVVWGATNPFIAGTLYGLANVPPAAAQTVAIAAGQFHALALQADGGVVGWGRDVEGQASVPADLPKAKAVAAGRLHSLALGRDGRVYGWGDNSHGELDPPAGLDRVLAIAAGWGFSVALVADHPRLGVGRGHAGELELTLEAEPGGDYAIECFESSGWWPLLSITNLEASPKILSDPAGFGPQGRFYRAVSR